MNPAALKTNIGDLPAGGALIVNSDAFTGPNLTKAGYATNPLDDGSLKPYNVFEIPICTLNARALEGLEHDQQAGRPDQELLRPRASCSGSTSGAWIRRCAGSRTSSASGRSIAEANARALKAGYAFGETTEIFHTHYRVAPAQLAAGHLPQHHRQRGDRARLRRRGRKLAERALFYGSYPITPASDILHQLSGYKNFGVKTFQAEDEIAAIGSAIGASYGGALGHDRHVRARASPSRARR